MIGRTISHYQILAKLGEGGMAVVYEALDVRLGRKVALKFLRGHTSPEAAERLLQEAQTVSSLDHPNICTVYEIDELPNGQRFIAMAFYEGKTLADRLRDGPLPLEEALEIVTSAAHGLHRAHQHGIIHQDIKPHNLMLLAGGGQNFSQDRPASVQPGRASLDRVKILDFGIAHLVGRPHGNPSEIYGTIAYMPPERFFQEYQADPRGDVWSLGLVFYEMVTGANPFDRGDIEETYEAIRKLPLLPVAGYADPEGVNLNVLLTKALARNPAERYADMTGLLHDLEALGRLVLSSALTQPVFRASRSTAALKNDSSPVSPSLLTSPHTAPVRTDDSADGVPLIAVLPFADNSPDRDQEHLCFGIAEELIRLFTSLGPLRVASFRTTRQFAEQGISLEDMHRRFHVTTVLEGSVHKAGDRLRVRVSLLRASDGLSLWSEKYDREFKDLFDIQDEIAERIVAALEVPLTGVKGEVPPASTEPDARPEAPEPDARAAVSEPETRPSDLNVEAYNLFLKGRYHWNKRSEGGMTRGIECFRQAIALEPDYARAWAGLADSYTMQGIYGWREPSKVMPRAREAAERALSSDGTLADVYASRACVRAVYEWDFVSAEHDLKRSIELDPDYAPAYQWYAMNLLLPCGRFAEAHERLLEARELDPLSLPITVSLGIFHYYRHAYEEAIAELENAVEADADFVPAHVFLARSYIALDRRDEALRELREAEILAGGERPDILAVHGYILAMTGANDEVKPVVTRLYNLGRKRYVSPLHRAQIFAALQRRRVAVDALRAAVDMRDSELVWLGLNPFFEPLHDEPDFKEALATIGLDLFAAESS